MRATKEQESTAARIVQEGSNPKWSQSPPPLRLRGTTPMDGDEQRVMEVEDEVPVAVEDDESKVEEDEEEAVVEDDGEEEVVEEHA